MYVGAPSLSIPLSPSLYLLMLVALVWSLFWLAVHFNSIRLSFRAVPPVWASNRSDWHILWKCCRHFGL